MASAIKHDEAFHARVALRQALWHAPAGAAHARRAIDLDAVMVPPGPGGVRSLAGRAARNCQ
jgi:hypothetical protein